MPKLTTSTKCGAALCESAAPSTNARPRRSRSITSFLASAVLAALFFSSEAWRHTYTVPSGHSQQEPDTTPGPASEWTNVPPSRNLQWQKCFDGVYDCARLDLPMDWLDPSDDLRVLLAVMRLPADPDATGDYMGPVFFNPGGPGGSGVWSIRDHGHLMQSIVGRNHDIITFDPRGVGASMPRVDCWRQDEKRHLWDLQDVGVPGAHLGNVADVYMRAAAFSSVCEESMRESHLLEHIGTASHARDMLEILNKTGYDKLRYWGFSYGTALGGYFASMYPDKVERLVSDGWCSTRIYACSQLIRSTGNVDYQEWAESKHINFLRDTDKVMEAFHFYCHQAGPARCPFHAESPQAISERLDKLLQSLKDRPLIVNVDAQKGPDLPQLITWSYLKRFINRTMYQPLLMFPIFARILADLEAGDGRSFYDTVLAEDPDTSFCSIEVLPPTFPRLEEGNGEVYPAVACADGLPNNDTLEDLVDILDRYKAISSVGGESFADFRLACIGRQVRPKWRFSGPFGGATRYPILYIANTADNVTPMVSARNNSALFPGSVILTQNSYGHTTLSAPSTCTAARIHAYFQNGTMPEEGEVCEPDYQPFDDIPATKTDHGLSNSQIGGPLHHDLEDLSKATFELFRSQWMPRGYKGSMRHTR